MTLVEILIATLILGIVAIGMVEFFARGRAGFDHEERKRVGTLLVQEALERTVARPYLQVVDWGEQRTISSVDYAISVTTQTDVPEQDMKTVLCTVAWDISPTEQRAAQLTTFVFDN